jgi:hypothetical protein
LAYVIRLLLHKNGEPLGSRHVPIHAEGVSAGLYLLQRKTEEIKRDLLWHVSGENVQKYNELMLALECEPITKKKTNGSNLDIPA